MKFATFDLEIAKEVPENMDDLMKFAPLGISCAALAFSDTEEVHLWKGFPKMTSNECQELVSDLQSIVNDGYTLVTWNGCGFDFRVLADESGLNKECGELALNHIDLMMIVTFKKGCYLSFQKALEGAKLKGKLKEVILSDGSVITDMNGAKAPQLWSQGEHGAVLAYLRDDVLQLLKLTLIVNREKVIRWVSTSGNNQDMRLELLYTVRDCFSIPEPDTSWMSDPPKRLDFVNWIPN